jgi:hypothetical protein
MLHVVKLIQRRYPVAGNRIIAALLLLSISALVIGLSMMLVKK